MAHERTSRSVFVGNIPYEATEEQLRDIFSTAGPVVNFRLVYDRETGKPKGYGFCEYQDLETAQSALRNLNNSDFNGRPLRVGPAAGETSKDEMKGMQMAPGMPITESLYGDAVEGGKAPEAISKAVASLPPEQMFELMKQMKMCIQNNPGEARAMLLQNPQLAYALLQAQIVMKIVDPSVAMSMLHRQEDQIPPVQPVAGPPSASGPPGPGPSAASSAPVNPPPAAVPMPLPVPPPVTSQGPPLGAPPLQPPHVPPRAPVPAPVQSPGMSNIPSPMAPGGPPPRPRGGLLGDRPPDMGGPRGFPGPGGADFGRPRGPSLPNDPRARAGDPRDPRGFPARPSAPAPQAGGAAAAAPGGGAPDVTNEDQEKAALIMQVLQLTPEQIALLPPDQRQSILVLKEQISRSAPN